MPNLTRRSLFALGGAGAAGVAIAGCAEEDDPRAEGRDGELLDRAAEAEAALGAVYEGLDAGPQANAAVRAFRDASSARLDELDRLGAAAADSANAESSAAAAITAANAAIAAYREGIRLLSTTEKRAPMIEFLTQVSAEQATLRGLENEDQSPQPFVTGLEERPYVASEDEDDQEDEDQ